jgi:hypothetical protein
MALLK